MRSFGSRFGALLLAALLAFTLTACSGGDSDDNGGGSAGGGETATSVTIKGTDALKFEPDSVTVAAGQPVTITLETDNIEHNFHIEGYQDGDMLIDAPAGQSVSATVTLDPGTYTFYCSVPGHREAGMEGTITAVAGESGE
jgi:plastocyanin